jgi:hypothetical protein
LHRGIGHMIDRNGAAEKMDVPSKQHTLIH